MMQIHPLVPVKKAASILGVSKDALRDKLSSGEIKGERRFVGQKEKWFIYAGQLDSLIDRRLADPKARTTIEGLSELFQEPENATVETLPAARKRRTLKPSAAQGIAAGEPPSAGQAHAQPSELAQTAAAAACAHDDQVSHIQVPEDAGHALYDQISQNQMPEDAIYALYDQVSQNQTPEDAIYALYDQVSQAEMAGESVWSQPPQFLHSAAEENQLQFISAQTMQIDGEVQIQLPAPEPLDLDQVVQSLTIEFAYRLAEQHQQVLLLQNQLEDREAQLRRLPLLEENLKTAARTKQESELELLTLRTHVAALEGQVQQLRRPLWKRVLGIA